MKNSGLKITNRKEVATNIPRISMDVYFQVAADQIVKTNPTDIIISHSMFEANDRKNNLFTFFRGFLWITYSAKIVIDNNGKVRAIGTIVDENGTELMMLAIKAMSAEVTYARIIKTEVDGSVKM